MTLLRGGVFIGLYLQLNLYDSWKIVPPDNGYIYISVQWHYWKWGVGGGDAAAPGGKMSGKEQI